MRLAHSAKPPRAHVNEWARAFRHLDIHPERQRRRQIDSVIEPHLLALVAEGRALEEQPVVAANVAADLRRLCVGVAAAIGDVPESDLLFAVIRNRFGDRSSNSSATSNMAARRSGAVCRRLT